MADKLLELGGSWDFEVGINDATGVNNGTLHSGALLLVDNTVFPDCKSSGVADSEDLVEGTSPDVNPLVGIPDDCQGLPSGGCCVGSYCVSTNINACISSDGTYLGDSVFCGVECAYEVCAARYCFHLCMVRRLRLNKRWSGRTSD